MDESVGAAQDIEDRLRKGSEQALAELFLQNRDRLRRTVRFRTHDRLRGSLGPDDILQESYLSAVQKLGEYAEAPLSPFLWLRSVLIETLTDTHRAHPDAKAKKPRRKANRGEDPYPQATAVSMTSFLAAGLLSPGKAAAGQETADRVRQAIEQMDPTDREVLALRHFEEMENREVAELLGLRPAAASNRYMRALKRLKSSLSETTGSQGEAGDRAD